MEILDALDEIKNMSRLDSKVSSEELFKFLEKRDQGKANEVKKSGNGGI